MFSMENFKSTNVVIDSMMDSVLPEYKVYLIGFSVLAFSLIFCLVFYGLSSRFRQFMGSLNIQITLFIIVFVLNFFAYVNDPSRFTNREVCLKPLKFLGKLRNCRTFTLIAGIGTFIMDMLLFWQLANKRNEFSFITFMPLLILGIIYIFQTHLTTKSLNSVTQSSTTTPPTTKQLSTTTPPTTQQSSTTTPPTTQESFTTTPPITQQSSTTITPTTQQSSTTTPPTTQESSTTTTPRNVVPTTNIPVVEKPRSFLSWKYRIILYSVILFINANLWFMSYTERSVGTGLYYRNITQKFGNNFGSSFISKFLGWIAISGFLIFDFAALLSQLGYNCKEYGVCWDEKITETDKKDIKMWLIVGILLVIGIISNFISLKSITKYFPSF